MKILPKTLPSELFRYSFGQGKVGFRAIESHFCAIFSCGIGIKILKQA